MTVSTHKPTTWFWIISIVSLIWNLIGVMAFYMQLSMAPEAIHAMPLAEQELYTSMPSWTMYAFALAVLGDTLGSVLLLLRKRLATPVFAIAFVFTLAQMVYTIFISNLLAVRGAAGVVFPVIILLVGVMLIWFANRSADKGWLR
jgi:Co/Zn/Cd efflux system component